MGKLLFASMFFNCGLNCVNSLVLFLQLQPLGFASLTPFSRIVEELDIPWAVILYVCFQCYVGYITLLLALFFFFF